jgi:Holliday junction resolvase
MLESKIQSKILKELKNLGIYAHKNITTNKKGVPDIIACYRGEYLALEVKNEKGRPSELQLWNIEEIRKSGGVADIVRSWEDVAILLRRMDNER